MSGKYMAQRAFVQLGVKGKEGRASRLSSEEREVSLARTT